MAMNEELIAAVSTYEDGALDLTPDEVAKVAQRIQEDFLKVIREGGVFRFDGETLNDYLNDVLDAEEEEEEDNGNNDEDEDEWPEPEGDPFDEQRDIARLRDNSF